MALPQDWREFIESLNSHSVEYVVIGAVALAHHGVPRYTGDIDILIRNSPENATRLEGALAAFGMGSVGWKAQDFTESYSVIELGVPPVRIDLLTSCSGVSFDEAWAGRVTTTVDGLSIPFMGRQELIRNKRRTGRPQDLADVALLESSSSNQS